MNIHDNIEIIDLALYLKNYKTLIISDLHIGIEESLNKQGILLPRFQFNDFLNKLKLIFMKIDVKRVIFNGDLKHEFGEISRQEWNNILKLFDFLKDKEIIIIKGNHDPILFPIAEKRNVKLVENYNIDNISVLHGDKILDDLGNILIIGHEHPAIRLERGIRNEMYSCFLKGEWKKKILIVMPSFNLLTHGKNVLKEKLISPFLRDIGDYWVYAVEPNEKRLSKTLYFGRIKDIKEL